MDKIDHENKSFKSYGAGGGLEFIIYDRTFSLFGEYMYDKSKHDVDIDLHAVHVGIKILS